jgi:hypothetical protein
MVCGFVPKAELAAALGSSALTSKGNLLGRGGSQPLTDSTCTVYADRRETPNFEVVVWDRSHDDGYTEWLLKHPKPNQTLFPPENPVGVANPSYSSRLDGTKTGELRTGAIATAIIGDWYINLRIYRPGKGRAPVTDAIALVQRIATALQLPTEASRTYSPFVPSSPSASSPAPSATSTS